ncbi:hypothetical protein TNCV_3961891 [Trichonephila clavipes]|nr:hypothetical protein TNCV_3961891 [Trichonephila clavipes]
MLETALDTKLRPLRLLNSITSSKTWTKNGSQIWRLAKSIPSPKETVTADADDQVKDPPLDPLQASNGRTSDDLFYMDSAYVFPTW